MLISEVEKGLPFLPLGTSEIGKLNQKQAHIRLRAAVLPVGVREPLTSSCFRKGQRLPVGEEGLLCVGHRWSEAEERCVVSRFRRGFPRWVSRQVDTRSKAFDHTLE